MKARSPARLFSSPEPESEPRTVPCCQCRTPVAIGEWAYQWANTVARAYLESRGDRPLREDELTRCLPCGRAWGEWRDLQAQRETRQEPRHATKTVSGSQDSPDHQNRWER